MEKSRHRSTSHDWAAALGAIPRAVALSESGRIVAMTADMTENLGIDWSHGPERTCRELLAPFLPDCQACPLARFMGPAPRPKEKSALKYPGDHPGPARRALCIPLESDQGSFYIHFLHSSPQTTRLLSLLATMDRLQLIEERMAFLVHELNNYLTAIAGHAELILADESHLAKHHASVIFRTVDRCHQILVQAKGWRSAAPSRSSRITPLQDVIEEVRETCRFALQLHRATLAIEMEDDIPAPAMDSTELLQVLSNLVINAAQAGRGNSRQTTITIRARRREDRLCIDVVDNGPGIPEDILGLVFEPYFTTKATGTGLGLALAKALVERAGGSIGAASDRTETTLHIELPLTYVSTEKS